MNDDDLKELFSLSRQADHAEAPSFDTLMRHPGGSIPGTRRRRLLPVLALAAMGSAGIVGAVLVLPRLRAPAAIDSAVVETLESPPAAQVVLSAPPPPPPPASGRSLTPQMMEKLEGLGYISGTESTSTASKYQAEFIEQLPTIGHNYQDIVTLAPGVTDTDGDGNPNVHGARDTGLRYRLDGGNITDPVGGGFAQNLNAALIEEIEVKTSGASAEHGDARVDRASNTESYTPVPENPFQRVMDHPLSTFSVDVDTASYSIVRRFLQEGQLPPPDAVRIEELINYFPYHDPTPAGNEPFAVQVEISGCPWKTQHRLARISLRGRPIAREDLPGSNLVFLLDVSGSMDHPAKLPLVKSSLTQLVSQLNGRDDVAIVVYAGSSGLVLPPTRGSAKSEILEALDRLSAGGSTNGGEGLQLAYGIARQHFVAGGINRVILATDGDFNVGLTDRGELVRFVEEQARGGISLTVLGFGMGNYKDDTLEMLADRGNGNYAYIDTPQEARKALVEQIGGTLMTIAKDVKIQVEFNPLEVGAYRLIGYENRILRREDFNDDRKDAGEIGAGHSVTALYELMPPGGGGSLPHVDELKYQSGARHSSDASSGESFTVKLRYKDPDGDTSRLMVQPVTDDGQPLAAASADLRFAAAVAAFGMQLRDSRNRGAASHEMAIELARGALDEDEGGYRAEFVRLVSRAVELSSQR